MRVNGDNFSHAGPSGSVPFPGPQVLVVKRALAIIQSRIRGRRECDSIFGALPNGRSFTSLFDDPNIWINYEPGNGSDYGWMTDDCPNDIVVTGFAMRMGRWTIAGTIVHELAHLNGADGTSHAAERTLRHCDLQSPRGPYDRSITG
jgi:hypothetical protein